MQLDFVPCSKRNADGGRFGVSEGGKNLALSISLSTHKHMRACTSASATNERPKLETKALPHRVLVICDTVRTIKSDDSARCAK